MAEPQEGWAIVPAEDKGAVPDLARALLALTDNVHDVVWIPGSTEFTVPDALAERYRESLTPSKTPARRTRAKKESSNG